MVHGQLVNQLQGGADEKLTHLHLQLEQFTMTSNSWKPDPNIPFIIFSDTTDKLSLFGRDTQKHWTVLHNNSDNFKMTEP